MDHCCISDLCFSDRKHESSKHSFMCFSVSLTLNSLINFQVISWVVKTDVLFKVKEPSSETVKKLLHSSDFVLYYMVQWYLESSYKLEGSLSCLLDK